MFLRQIGKSLLITAAALALGIGSSPVVNAAENTPDYRLQISPTQGAFEDLEPGNQYSNYFEIQNTGNKELDFELELAPYSVTNDKYDPDFSTTSKFSEIVDWITLSEESGSVEPGNVAKIEYEINVPDDAPAGGQNAAIIIRATNVDEAETPTAIQTIKQVSYIIYSNVSGETKEAGSISSNKVPSFLFSPPVVTTSVVKNEGNVYTRASYTLEVKSFFGGNTVYTNAESPDTLVILPDTERYNEVSWEGAPQIGLFKVKQTVKIFDEVSEVEKVVFLCPIWFLVLIIAIIGVAIFWIVSHILKRKQQ